MCVCVTQKSIEERGASADVASDRASPVTTAPSADHAAASAVAVAPGTDPSSAIGDGVGSSSVGVSDGDHVSSRVRKGSDASVSTPGSGGGHHRRDSSGSFSGQPHHVEPAAAGSGAVNLQVAVANVLGSRLSNTDAARGRGLRSCESVFILRVCLCL